MEFGVFLRNTGTGQYYASPGRWVGDSPHAHDFCVVEDAFEFARTRKFVGVEVVLRYEDPACDLVLPLRQD